MFSHSILLIAVQSYISTCSFCEKCVMFFLFKQGGKGILLKSVGVVAANPDTVFEVVLDLDKHKRYE